MVEDAVGKILVGGEPPARPQYRSPPRPCQQRRSLWHLKNISQGSVRSHRPQVRQVQIGRNSADIPGGNRKWAGAAPPLYRAAGALPFPPHPHSRCGAAVGGAEPGDPKDRRSGGIPQLGGHLSVRLVIGSPDKGHAGSVSALANHIQKLHSMSLLAVPPSHDG